MIQELRSDCVHLSNKYAKIVVPSAPFLNQINKIRETELLIYPSSFVISTYLLLKTSLRPHQTRVCLTGFRATFFNFCLREFLLSAFANRFELRCEPKRLMLLYYKICPCCTKAQKYKGPGFEWLNPKNKIWLAYVQSKAQAETKQGRTKSCRQAP